MDDEIWHKLSKFLFRNSLDDTYGSRLEFLKWSISRDRIELDQYTDPSVREQITKKINLKEQELYRRRNRPETEDRPETEAERIQLRTKEIERRIERAYEELESNKKKLSYSVLLLAAGFVSFALGWICILNNIKDVAVVAFFISLYPGFMGMISVPWGLVQRASIQKEIKGLNNE